MSLRQPERKEQTEQREPADGDLLELLDAEYTRDIIEAIREEPKSARRLADECGASRPTVYRRLNTLQEAGLVESELAYDADGHHRTVFEATVETLSVDVTDDGLSVTVNTGGSDRDAHRPPERGSRYRP